MKRHIVDHETKYRVYTLCGYPSGGYLKGTSIPKDYPWKETDEPCKHCERLKEQNDA